MVGAPHRNRSVSLSRFLQEILGLAAETRFFNEFYEKDVFRADADDIELDLAKTASLSDIDTLRQIYTEVSRPETH